MLTLETVQGRTPTSKLPRCTTSTLPRSRVVKVSISIIFLTSLTTVKTEMNLSAPCATGHWGIWGSWSACSQSCGNGTSTRTRDCYTSVTDRLVDPGNCHGEQEKIARCNEMKCPGKNSKKATDNSVCGRWCNKFSFYSQVTFLW